MLLADGATTGPTSWSRRLTASPGAEVRSYPVVCARSQAADRLGDARASQAA